MIPLNNPCVYNIPLNFILTSCVQQTCNPCCPPKPCCPEPPVSCCPAPCPTSPLPCLPPPCGPYNGLCGSLTPPFNYDSNFGGNCCALYPPAFDFLKPGCCDNKKNCCEEEAECCPPPRWSCVNTCGPPPNDPYYPNPPPCPPPCPPERCQPSPPCCGPVYTRVPTFLGCITEDYSCPPRPICNVNPCLVKEPQPFSSFPNEDPCCPSPNPCSPYFGSCGAPCCSPQFNYCPPVYYSLCLTPKKCAQQTCGGCCQGPTPYEYTFTITQINASSKTTSYSGTANLRGNVLTLFFLDSKENCLGTAIICFTDYNPSRQGVAYFKGEILENFPGSFLVYPSTGCGYGC